MAQYPLGVDGQRVRKLSCKVVRKLGVRPDFDGPGATFIGRKLGNPNTRPLLENLPEWDFEKDPRGFLLIGELPKTPRLINGDFSKGLEGWALPTATRASKDPTYRIEATKGAGAAAARLAVKYCGTPCCNNDECVELYLVIDRPVPRSAVGF
jgi:hypothetical protein